MLGLRAILFGGLIVVLVGTYFVGYRTGASNVTAAFESDRITILKDGKEIDSAVEALDDSGLCAVLGGCELPEHSGD